MTGLVLIIIYMEMAEHVGILWEMGGWAICYALFMIKDFNLSYQVAI